MPLIKVEALNYYDRYANDPRTETGFVNTDDIQQIRPADARGSGHSFRIRPFFRIRFRDGQEITCRGRIEDVERLIAATGNPC